MAPHFEDEDEYPEPSNQDDKNEAYDYEVLNFDTVNADMNLDSSKTEPDRGDHGQRTPLDENFTKSSSNKREKNRKKKDEPEPEPEHHQQQHQTPPPNPTIPDDTTYIPNPGWTRREKGIISLIQSLPTMDMRRDHMTRFKVNNEQPTSISRWEVSPRDHGDIDVFFGPTKFSQHYLITFTRKSRKPIFNPIN